MRGLRGIKINDIVKYGEPAVYPEPLAGGGRNKGAARSESR